MEETIGYGDKIDDNKVSCHPFLGFFFLYYMYYMVAAWVHRPRSTGAFAGRNRLLHQLGVDHNFSNSG